MLNTILSACLHVQVVKVTVDEDENELDQPRFVCGDCNASSEEAPAMVGRLRFTFKDGNASSDEIYAGTSLVSHMTKGLDASKWGELGLPESASLRAVLHSWLHQPYSVVGTMKKDGQGMYAISLSVAESLKRQKI